MNMWAIFSKRKKGEVQTVLGVLFHTKAEAIAFVRGIEDRYEIRKPKPNEMSKINAANKALKQVEKYFGSRY